MPRNALFSAFIVVVSFGCSSMPPPSSSMDTDAGATGGGTPSPMTVRDAGVLIGTFIVLHAAGDGTDATSGASVIGRVYDGPTPAAIIWEKSSEEADCQLAKPRVPFCATPCGGSAICVENDTCQPVPPARSVGAIKVNGLVASAGPMEFEMTPIVNAYQPPVSVMLAKPPFSDGAAVTLSAAGNGVFMPFTLSSMGVAPFLLQGPAATLERNKPVTFAWTPGAAATGARIKLKLDISHHGGTKGEIRCDTADDGSLTISAAMMTSLLDLGVAGFPTVVARREKAGSTAIAQGRVDLLVVSEQEKEVIIPGLVSCNDDSQCTAPQKCQPDLRCQ
jgi:hypothetical protein